MDALTLLLDDLKKNRLAETHLRGMLHVIIGRRITQKKTGAIVSQGVSWRELANLLQRLRWPPEAVAELGLDADELPPRDRQRFWYSAIARAQVDSPEAQAAGDRFAAVLKKRGYEVGPPPRPRS